MQPVVCNGHHSHILDQVLRAPGAPATQPRGPVALAGRFGGGIGFWALVLAICMFFMLGRKAAVEYINNRNNTEPMFVFAVMVIAATRPILQTATALLQWLAREVPLGGSLGYYSIVMVQVPLMGSFITEPAAMTLAALILGNRFFARNLSTRLKYATLGVLFVNISVGARSPRLPRHRC